MTLEELTRNPASAAGLHKTELAALLVQCAAAMSAIGAAILGQPEPEPLNEDTKDTDNGLLTVDETAAMLHKTRRWVYRNAERLGFARRLGYRSLLCSRRGIERVLNRGF